MLLHLRFISPSPGAEPAMDSGSLLFATKVRNPLVCNEFISSVIFILMQDWDFKALFLLISFHLNHFLEMVVLVPSPTHSYYPAKASAFFLSADSGF